MIPQLLDRAPLTAQVSKHFPAEARLLLTLAAQTPDPAERKLAIEHAAERVRAMFPHMFRPDA